MKKFSLSFLCLFCLIFSISQAQTETQKRDEKTMETNIRGNRFKLVNNYVNVGIGFARQMNRKRNDFPIAAAYNFRVANLFFQAGYLRSAMPGFSDAFSRNFLNDIHLAINLRRENRVMNVSYVLGPSLAYGLFDNNRYSHAGIYAEVQLIRKLFYDIGLGFCPFVAYNIKYPLAGIRLEVFLSGSYQGKINAQ
jgi:hypothetical protein